MAAPLDDNGFDDDDFGDFGGFEAADPVNVPAQENPAVQAAPNVWAAMFVPAVQGTSNVQPDLLCGQNRFPQHLDNPLTLDVAGSAQASIPPVDVGGQDGAVGGAGLLQEPDLGGLQDTDELDLDNINLANDILDGSFRSASTNQSGAGFQSHGVEQMPDISGLDLAAGIVNNVSEPRLEVENTSQPRVENENVPSQRLDTDNISNAAPSPEQSENRNVELANQAPASAQDVTNEVVRNEFAAVRMNEVSERDALLQRANEEKEALQKEIEKQLSENSRLSEDLARAQQLAEAAKQSYDELQSKHEKQLEELRQAGHETLSIVVEEYKCLLNSTIQQQQEVNEQRLSQRLKEETERLREILKSQKEEFDSLQEEERKKNEEKIGKAVEEMKVRQKEEFDALLAEERIKCEEKVKVELQKEQEATSKEIEKVIEEEQLKAKEMLETEQETFKNNLAGEMEKQRSEMETALKEQKEKYEDQLHEALKQERTNSKESVQETAQCVKDDMNQYLKQQREADRSTQRRQLASLDLFLESARHQLSLLMDNNSSVDIDMNKETGKDQS
ncbi:coiled-coil domain-containing protein 91-like [Mercenaria mercenaria]|uniref:coiled-coil domain-containing protein 91-like n=1 Tax=Mercenaria mercenaria TaxID=6596 RepID=UPI00234FA307|nr:coiled-coil domain-containing protein 91-like [Mercenaria mercenaria]